MPLADNDSRFWDRIARGYAKSKIGDMAGYERTIERTGSYLKTTDTVLEFGCGTGTTALQLAPSVARYVATDVSSEMIAIGREKALEEGGATLKFEVATLATAPWPDESFDAVLGFNILHLIEKRDEAYASVRRLLKPGGLFISKTPCLKQINPLIRAALPLMQALGRAPYVAFFSPEELEREIAASPFEIVESARHGSGKKDARPYIVARKG